MIGRFSALRCFPLRPIIQLRQSRLDLFEQLVLLGDLSIHIPFFGADAALLHLRSGNAHVNGRYLLNALPLVATVIDALSNSVSLQCSIGQRRP